MNRSDHNNRYQQRPRGDNNTNSGGGYHSKHERDDSEGPNNQSAFDQRLFENFGVMLCHSALSNDWDENTLLAKPHKDQNYAFVHMKYLVENTADFILYYRQFDEGRIEPTVLGDLQAFFIMFMPYEERLSNPHLRAKLSVPSAKVEAGPVREADHLGCVQPGQWAAAIGWN